MFLLAIKCDEIFVENILASLGLLNKFKVCISILTITIPYFTSKLNMKNVNLA